MPGAFFLSQKHQRLQPPDAANPSVLNGSNTMVSQRCRLLLPRFFVFLLFIGATSLSAPTAFADSTTSLEIRGEKIVAIVAHSPAQLKKGLMGQKRLGKNKGMLFVFPTEDRHSMWMKNTLIPLSAAFIDKEGVIINIVEMKPQTLDLHSAQKPAKYVLEMNSGWFQKHGGTPGDPVKGLPSPTQ